MTRRTAALLVFLFAVPAAAQAQGQGQGRGQGQGQVYGDPAAPHGETGPITVGGRAPWHPAWAYDSGGDNDRRPELSYYQQGGGQQTGGPARNLLPDDGLRLVPIPR